MLWFLKPIRISGQYFHYAVKDNVNELPPNNFMSRILLKTILKLVGERVFDRSAGSII